ncbi:MAG: 23S rRNA (adenine(2030)-N(6))-methyltransferase RlmJ [Methylophilaceae bacterium]
MLSYRHAFHAGNHADVLKHFIFAEVLGYFTQKDKPFWVVDSHAGAGLYQLENKFSQKNAEFENGIARLYVAKNLPEHLTSYIEIITQLNESNTLKLYPGSPFIAKHFLRDGDKLRLFELHPNDYKSLSEKFTNQGHHTIVKMLDGFAGLKSCLPPLTKRGVVLIDPPYELKEDYQQVVTAVKDSLNRFATGTYMVWYPLLQRPEPKAMVEKLKMLNKDWLNVTLSVQTPSDEGFGMFGSGMLVINPPWTLPKILEETMPYLTDTLAQDEHASYTLENVLT